MALLVLVVKVVKSMHKLTDEVIQKAVLDSRDGSKWVELNEVLDSIEFYSRVCSYIIDTSGHFSVVRRISPFSGEYTSVSWDELWKDVVFSTHQVDDWLGTNVLYIDGDDRRIGETYLLAFNARMAEGILKSVSVIADWRPPRPDDFACYASSGMLIGFANAHEDEFYVRKNSPLQLSVQSLATELDNSCFRPEFQDQIVLRTALRKLWSEVP